MRIRYTASIILFLSLLALAAGFSVASGSVDIALRDILNPAYRNIIILRLARTALAAIAGASLALVGTILQGLLKNPLADPYVLGVSSGSGLGAVLAITFGISSSLGGLFLPLSAFLGGITAFAFVYFLSKKGARVGTEDLLLSGVIVSSMLSGVIIFIVSAVETEGLHSALWWLLGSTQIYDMRILAVLASVVLAGIIISTALARNLNIMSLGEEEAVSMGINTELIKSVFFAISSLVTAAVVSACGMIGFVGLIIPHIARKFVGPDHRQLIPAASLCGALFLVLCDIISRRFFAPIELPIGVITACFGGPFFILLLKKARRLRV